MIIYNNSGGGMASKFCYTELKENITNNNNEMYILRNKFQRNVHDMISYYLQLSVVGVKLLFHGPIGVGGMRVHRCESARACVCTVYSE